MIMKTTKLILTLFVAVTVCITNITGQTASSDSGNFPMKKKLEIVYQTDNAVNFQHVKTAIDSKGNLFAVFYDPYNSKTYYATNKSGEWKAEEIITTDENSGYAAMYPAIAIDKSDNIHVVFTRYKDKLVHGQKSVLEKEWNFTEINSDNTPELVKFYVFENYIDICTDDNNGIHLILSGEGRDTKEKPFDWSLIYFYKPVDGKWSSQIIKRGITDSPNRFGKDPSISVENKKIHLSFGGINSVHYASKNIGSTSWNIEQLFSDGNANAVKESTTLAIDNYGQPVFAYVDLFDSDRLGLNVASKSSCNNTWAVDNSLSENIMRAPAIAVNNDGVVFLAYNNGNKGFSVSYRNCDCNRIWETIFVDADNYTEFTDAFISYDGHFHAFYTTEDAIKHVDVWYDGSLNCNYRPSVSFKGKTNVKPGEDWSCTITASDTECDPVKIYSIILPDNFKLADHGNGTASLKGTIEKGEGFGDILLVVLCNDDKHPDANAKHSKVSIRLRLTQEGIEKGSVTYDNNCDGKEGTIVNTSVMSQEGNLASQNTKEVVNTTANTETESTLNAEQSKTCKEYLDRYEAWANKYIPVKKEVNKNPMNMNAIMALANMAPELGNWGLEWSQKYECSNDPEFMARYEKISERIDEVNN